jgi:biotin carboxyl carrier protein
MAPHGALGTIVGQPMNYRVKIAGRCFEIDVDHEHRVWVDGQPLYVDLEQISGLPLYSLRVDEAGYLVFVEDGQAEPQAPAPYRVEVMGEVYGVEVERRRPGGLVARPGTGSCDEGRGCVSICTPLAGRLSVLSVEPGQWVEAGQVLALVESMKMLMELKAPGGGVVEAVYGPAERDVAQGEELVLVRLGGGF